MGFFPVALMAAVKYGATSYLVYIVLLLSFILGLWLRDVVRESTYQKKYNPYIMRGVAVGFILSLVAQSMFYLSIFFALFTLSLRVGNCPVGSLIFLNINLPAVGSVLLCLSSCVMTESYVRLQRRERKITGLGLILAFLICSTFGAVQFVELSSYPMPSEHGPVATLIYIAIWAHLAQVIVAIVSVLVSWARFVNYHFPPGNEISFMTGATLYIHFVDVIWLFLLVVIYWWGT